MKNPDTRFGKVYQLGPDPLYFQIGNIIWLQISVPPTGKNAANIVDRDPGSGVALIFWYFLFTRVSVVQEMSS